MTPVFKNFLPNPSPKTGYKQLVVISHARGHRPRADENSAEFCVTLCLTRAA